ncbi:nuclear transport factor 2 family protein, partial [Acinetobacter baumannii]
VFGNGTFRYVREVIDGPEAVLEFEAEMDGIKVNGIDMIRFDLEGRIVDFKVMVRPLKAINKVWELMAVQLENT